MLTDDVNHIKQLEALANKPTWFGPGSRILVTTENKDLLQRHGINNTYHVGFPSNEQALKILCGYAFRQSYPHDGFEKLAKRATELSSNLPLGLRVVGSSLLGKKEDEWKDVMSRLETILDRDIEDVLRVGYDSLDEKEQTLFLHIAVFFNYTNDDSDLETMFAGSDLNVKHGLTILANRSLVKVCTHTKQILIHRLLKQVGIKAIHKQEPWKRRILMDPSEICDVLEDAKGTSDVSGISLDTSGINEVCISDRAFKRMRNLRFLKVYKSREDGNSSVHIPEEMEFPRRLRLLHWEAYPSKSFPPRFQPEYLVELVMQQSKLEKLWDGIKPLTNLKKLDLSESFHLKELPDLSKATNLEKLYLSDCQSLVELPSSISNLQKLKTLWLNDCLKLEVIPTNWNLTSLELFEVSGCSRLPNFPCISTNIRGFTIVNTEVKEVPTSITHWSQLGDLEISGNGKLKTLPQLPTTITWLGLSNNGFERISDCCFKDIRRLRELTLSGCRKITSLPELPLSLEFLDASDCESLETVFFPFVIPLAELNFINCFKLDQQARRAIIQQSFFLGAALLPGRQVPVEFNHRAMGNSLTFTLPAFSSFKVCLVISPNQLTGKCEFPKLLCRRLGKGYVYPIEEMFCSTSTCQEKHLYVFHSEWIYEYRWLEESTEIMFEFSSKFQDFDVTECGAKILTYKTDDEEEEEASDEEDDDEEASDEEDDDEEASDEEGDKSEPGEASHDDDEDIAEGDYESVSRKRRRNTKMTIASRSEWGIKRRRS